MQLERLERVFRPGPGSGTGGLGVITGAVGTGKSFLLDAVCERAREQGLRVLTASCSTFEQTLQYGMIDQLFRDLALAGELPRMPDALHAERTRDDPSPGMLRFFHEVLTLVARGKPALLAVDDIQFADEPSLRCLLYLTRRSRATSVSTFVTHAEQYGTTTASALAELLHHPLSSQVRTGPLTRAAIRHLTSGLPGCDDPWLDRAEHLTGGNPLLVQALLRDLDQPGEEAADLVGAALVAASVNWLHRSGSVGLAVARGIAVLEGQGGDQTLVRLLDLEERAVKRARQLLAGARILDEDGGFLLPQVRAAVLDDLDPEETVRLRRAAAQLLHTEGAPVTTVADHLLDGGPPRESWAIKALTDAGRQAIREDRTEDAVRLLRMAEQHTDDDAERALLGAEVAASMWRIRPEATLQQLRMLSDRAVRGQVPVEHMISLVPGLLWYGMSEQAQAVLAAGLEQAGADPGVATALRSVQQWVANTYPGMETARAATDRAAITLPDPLGESPEQRALDALTAVLRGEQGESIGFAAERVLQSLVLSDHHLLVLIAAVTTLLYDGRVVAAWTWASRLCQQAAERNAPTWQALLGSARSLVALRRGDLPDAARLAGEALTLMSPVAWGVGIGAPLSAAIEAAVGMGDRQTAADLVARPVPDQMINSRFGLQYLAARGWHHLAEDRAQAALADFLSCGERMQAWDIDSAELALWRVGAAQAWLRINNRDRATQLLEEQLARLDPARPAAHGATLRVYASLKPLRQQHELLNQALEQVQAGGNRYQVALVLADLAQLHQQLGDPGKARTFARRAWRIAKDCGAEALHRSLLPGSEPSARPGKGGGDELGPLTEAERRVASLAAQGHTNREIAARLFITVSTVEQHLTRVFRKLDVVHRQDLPSSLAFDESDLNTA